MSNPDFMPSRRSVTFPADAKCPAGYLLVESAPSDKPHSGFRPHTHLAPYETVSAMARGVIGATARTLCDKRIHRDWSFVPREHEDHTPTRTTCRACLSAIRKALA